MLLLFNKSNSSGLLVEDIRQHVLLFFQYFSESWCDLVGGKKAGGRGGPKQCFPLSLSPSTSARMVYTRQDRCGVTAWSIHGGSEKQKLNGTAWSIHGGIAVA